MGKERPWRRESLVVAGRDGQNLRIQAQPDVVFGNLQRALQRTLDLAALALQLSSRSGEQGTHPELEVFPRVRLGSRIIASELESHYPSWVMGHAVTDIVEALEPLLTDVLRICRAAALRKQDLVNEDEVVDVLEPNDLEMPLGQKLERAAAEVPGLIPEQLGGALKSLNKLRVCLTHAGGRVRKRDCNVAGSLELSRIFWEYWVEYESGESEPAVRGMVSQGPGWLVMRRSREPRRFEVGQQIELDLDDLVRIAMTVHELGLVLRKNLYSHLRLIGWLPEGFEEPDSHITISAEFDIPEEREVADRAPEGEE